MIPLRFLSVLMEKGSVMIELPNITRIEAEQRPGHARASSRKDQPPVEDFLRHRLHIGAGEKSSHRRGLLFDAKSLWNLVGERKDEKLP